MGLSQAGLLHYFGFQRGAVRRDPPKGDDVDRLSRRPEQPTRPQDTFLRILAHKAEIPGLVELFSRLGVDAADPNPANAYFLERGD